MLGLCLNQRARIVRQDLASAVGHSDAFAEAKSVLGHEQRRHDVERHAGLENRGITGPQRKKSSFRPVRRKSDPYRVSGPMIEIITDTGLLEDRAASRVDLARRDARTDRLNRSVE